MNLNGPLATIARYARRTHTASCVITRAGAAEPVFDENTGEYTDPARVTVYDGACTVIPEGADRVQNFGDGPVVTRVYAVSLDGLDDGVEEGDDIVFTSPDDPRVDQIEAVVVDAPGSSLPTNRQLLVEETVTKPIKG